MAEQIGVIFTSLICLDLHLEFLQLYRPLHDTAVHVFWFAKILVVCLNGKHTFIKIG